MVSDSIFYGYRWIDENFNAYSCINALCDDMMIMSKLLERKTLCQAWRWRRCVATSQLRTDFVGHHLNGRSSGTNGDRSTERQFQSWTHLSPESTKSSNTALSFLCKMYDTSMNCLFSAGCLFSKSLAFLWVSPCLNIWFPLVFVIIPLSFKRPKPPSWKLVVQLYHLMK